MLVTHDMGVITRPRTGCCDVCRAIAGSARCATSSTGKPPYTAGLMADPAHPGRRGCRSTDDAALERDPTRPAQPARPQARPPPPRAADLMRRSRRWRRAGCTPRRRPSRHMLRGQFPTPPRLRGVKRCGSDVIPSPQKRVGVGADGEPDTPSSRSTTSSGISTVAAGAGTAAQGAARHGQGAGRGQLRSSAGETFFAGRRVGCGRRRWRAASSGSPADRGQDRVRRGRPASHPRGRWRGRRMQMIFGPCASPNPRWRVKKIVAEPLVTCPRRRSGGNRGAGRRFAGAGGCLADGTVPTNFPAASASASRSPGRWYSRPGVRQPTSALDSQRRRKSSI